MRRSVLAFLFLFFIALKANAQLDTKHYFSPMHAGSDTDGGNQFLYLSTPSTTAFTVTITDGAGTVLASPSISNSAPYMYAVGTAQSTTTKMFVVKSQLNTPLTGRGLILTAPQPFYANFRVEDGVQAEMMTAKGMAALGTTFRVGGFPQANTSFLVRNFFVSVMATDPGVTSVTINGYNSGIVFAGSSNFSAASISFTLNQGQSYVISGYASDATANLTGIIGALVTSDKNIVLENGNILGTIANSASQDMGFDQSVPISKLGKDYIVVEGNGVAAMELPIIIAHSNNTQLFINGSTTAITTLNAGQYYIVPNSNYQGSPHRNMYIRTSQPAYVYQALSGASSDATGGLNFIPPFNCYLPHAVDNIMEVDKIGSVAYTGYAMIFTQRGASVTINGAVQTGAVPVLGALWDTYRVSITGNVKIASTNAMAMGLLGASGSAGYAGYFAGFSDIPSPSDFTYVDTCFNLPTHFTSIHNVNSSITKTLWNFGDPASGLNDTSTQDSPAHTFSALGTYNVKLIIYRTTCNDTVNRTVKIIGASGTISGSANVCLNAAQPVVTFNATLGTAPFTFTYKINNGSSQTITTTSGNSVTLNAPTTTAGTFKYYLTSIQDSGPPLCNLASDSITITVNSSLPVTVNSEALCFGETATLTASGATSYSWAPNTGLSATTGTTVTATPTTPVTYTVIGTANGCSGTGYSTVSINPTPDSHAGTDITLCSGTTGTIGAPTTVGYVYSWLPATGLNNTTVADPTVNMTNFTASPITTTYTVTTSPAGCFSTDEVTVTINPSLDPAFNYASATFCKSGGGANPSPVIVSAGGTFTFTPAGLSINSSSGLVDLALSNLGTYTVTYNTGGACPASSAQIITITNIPDAQFSYGTYCQNVIPNPTPIFPLGASAGIFTANSSNLAFVSGSSAPGEVDLATSIPGTYTITNTIAAGGGCPSAIATNTIIINAIPSVTVNSETICNGGSATLTASGANSYSWSDASSGSSITVNPTLFSSYTVTGTAAGCSNSAIATITVNSIPVVTVNDASICVGALAALTASGAGSYAWSEGTLGNTLSVSPVILTSYTVTGTTLGCSASAIATVTVNHPPLVMVNDATVCAGASTTLSVLGANSYLWSTLETTASINVSPGTNTSYTVTGTTSGCTGSAIATVTVNNSPNVTVNSSTICLGGSTTLTAQGANSYSWSDGSTGTSITVNPLSNSSYTVTGTSANCPATAVATVFLNNPVIVTVNSATICAGQTAILTASGATAYIWSNGSLSNQISVSPLANATYTITGNPTACPGSAVATVLVNSLPVITVNSTSICFGFSSTLTASGANAYTWSTGANTNSITTNPAIPTTYTVTGTNGFGCMDTSMGTITVFPKPIAQFNANPNPAKMLSPLVYFTDLSSPDVSNWFWDFGDGDSLTTVSQNISHTYPSDTAIYTVTLIVHNDGACYDTAIHFIEIGPEFAFYIPNSFSPNDDQKNDVFFGTGTGIAEYHITIFDRWGNFIFYSDDMNKGWDGKANTGSDIVLQDTYVWKVEILDVLKKKHSFIGTVTISK